MLDIQDTPDWSEEEDSQFVLYYDIFHTRLFFVVASQADLPPESFLQAEKNWSVCLLKNIKCFDKFLTLKQIK